MMQSQKGYNYGKTTATNILQQKDDNQKKITTTERLTTKKLKPVAIIMLLVAGFMWLFSSFVKRIFVVATTET